MKLIDTEAPLVTKHGQQVFTTSRDVASKFGKEHKSVLRAIQRLDCSEEFMRRNFAPHSYTDERGNNQPMFHVTRDGFVFLVMGFRGKEAATWKEKYIDAFNRMEAALTRQANIAWKEQRAQGKGARRELTDTIKLFVEYATNQGSTHASRYYQLTSQTTYRCLFLIEHNSNQAFRDLLDFKQLSFLTTAELVATHAIEDGMADNLPYKQIFQLAKGRVEAFAGVIPRSVIISGGQRAIAPTEAAA